MTAPPASFRESGWKRQPNAVSKAIISSVKDGLYTGGQMPYDTLLDELCEEAQRETRGVRSFVPEKAEEMYGISFARTVNGEGDYREVLSNQLRKYYNYYGLNSAEISDFAHTCESKLGGFTNEKRKYLNDGTTWSVIDFVDIPVSLASRLTDDDIGATLVCIGAKNKLERLNLTNCFNFVGHGLEPPRSSTVLETLDLGMYRHFETPLNLRGREVIFREIKLSEGPVCDIVDSFLCGEGENSFKRLQYPFEWYHKHLDDIWVFDLISGTMDQIMRSKRMIEFVNGHNAAVVKSSCSVYFNYDSKEELCFSINEESREMNDRCIRCDETSFAVCSHCDEIMCSNCANPNECNRCNSKYCRRCQDDGFDNVSICNEGEEDCEWLCTECRLNGCRSGENDCPTCICMAFKELDRSKSVMFTDYPPITIRIKDTTGETLVTVERGTKMETLFQAFAERKCLDVSDLRFTLRGETIQSDSTPKSLDLNDMAEIEAAW